MTASKPNKLLKAQKWALYSLAILLVLLFNQLFSSQLFSPQPANTKGLTAITEADLEIPFGWSRVQLPHSGASIYSGDTDKNIYRLTVPEGTPTVGHALLIPSFRYELDYWFNNNKQLSQGNHRVLWKNLIQPYLVIPLDLRYRGVSGSVIELTVTGPTQQRGIDKLWIGPIALVEKAKNPVLDFLPHLMQTAFSALVILLLFLAIDASVYRSSRLYFWLLLPQIVFTFLYLPSESLSLSIFWYKVFKSSVLFTVLAWGTFALEAANIRLNAARNLFVISVFVLSPMWFATSVESTNFWAEQVVGSWTTIAGIYLAFRCLHAWYHQTTSTAELATLFLCTALLGSCFGNWLSENNYHNFSQAIAFSYIASLVALGLFARTALHIAERSHELQLHQKSLSQLVLARTKALEDAQSKLIRQERFQTLNAMGAAISHEIKNPLSTLNNDLQTLNKLNATPSDAESKVLSRMHRSIRRIDKTLGDLSSFVKHDVIAAQSLDFSAWLVELLKDNEVSSLTTGAIVQHQVEAGLKLRFDPDMLHRAISNLIQNAMRACSERYKPQLFIVALQNDSTIVVRIEDNGTGIPPELGDQIFEPMVSGGQVGLGLGLTVVRDIVHLHKGRLEIANRTDATGAVVSLFFPIETESFDEQHSERSAASPPLA